jgi:amino acid transporter
MLDSHTRADIALLALTISGLLYGLSAWSMSVATGPDKIVARASADGTELIFNLVRAFVGQGLLDVGHVLFVTSLFASALAFHNTAARYFYALGREHVLPARLGGPAAAPARRRSARSPKALSRPR